MLRLNVTKKPAVFYRFFVINYSDQVPNDGHH